MPNYKDYEIGWICALPIEFAAAQAMLDTVHEPLPNRRRDENTYVYGTLGQHDIVIACLPAGIYGTTSATAVGMQMRASFPALRFCLLVGIAGGAPSPHDDIRLGDVVVSKPTAGYSGVLQYDYGKSLDEDQFVLTGVLNKPPAVLLAAISRLQAKHYLRESSISQFCEEALRKVYLRESLSNPGYDSDLLFKPGYGHAASSSPDTCDQCNRKLLQPRLHRNPCYPRVFYGLVASANQVLRSAFKRDTLARTHGILCFEMEAAGLIDILPCLVIRGVCDYCDSHKTKRWQGYASLTAAAYAKELLSVIPPKDVSDTVSINESVEYGKRLNEDRDPFNEADSWFEDSLDRLGTKMGTLHAPGNSKWDSSDQNLIVIGIHLEVKSSKVAWATADDFSNDKVQIVTQWEGFGREVAEVPNEIVYEGNRIYWGYSIPSHMRRLAWYRILTLTQENLSKKSYDDRSPKILAEDYLRVLCRHALNHIRHSQGSRPVTSPDFCIVLTVLVLLRDELRKIILDSAKRAIKRVNRLANNTTVTVAARTEAAALGVLCHQPVPLGNAYVVCYADEEGSELLTHRIAQISPIVLEEVTDPVRGFCGGKTIDKAFQDMCEERLERKWGALTQRGLRELMIGEWKHTIRPMFRPLNPNKQYIVNIPEDLLKEGGWDDDSYEPFIKRGRIAFREADIQQAFTETFSEIVIRIDDQIKQADQAGIAVQGIILAGSLGSSPYLFKHLTSIYAETRSIDVFQDFGNIDIAAYRGAVYKGFVEPLTH